MGTDIHLAVERRDKDGHWHRVPDPIRDCPDYLHNKSRAEDEKVCYWCKGTLKRTESFYPHRDYDVFAILADVRNGSGFAGCVTGDGFEILSPPRGFPHDLSPELAKAARHAEGESEDDAPGDDEMWFGDHSFSWLTVDEILRGAVAMTNVDEPCYWLLETKHRGVVGPQDYLLWKRDGRPAAWSGDVSGGKVRKVTPAEMGAMILAGRIKVDETAKSDVFDNSLADDGFHYVTTVEWTETYAEAAKFFLEMVYRDLLPLGHPRDTRIVFGFDS